MDEHTILMARQLLLKTPSQVAYDMTPNEINEYVFLCQRVIREMVGGAEDV